MEPDHSPQSATDGEIAAVNLESARRHAWVQFARDPGRQGLAETIIDSERLALQFLGDPGALDRMVLLSEQLVSADASFRADLVQAQVASAGHRFQDARCHLGRAARKGGPSDAILRQRLAIDQACGLELETVIATRRRIAAFGSELEELVPIAAALADLERFTEADIIYRRAFYSYQGVSPFALALICFQLGMLWGELVPEPDPKLAALWYKTAIAYLPCYVKARVHLAEIFASRGFADHALALLTPVISSSDPEVHWRIADILMAQGSHEEATAELEIARSGFEDLLDRHTLAFADHAAEFYVGSGNNRRRALYLAQVNFANRPTSLAAKQLEAIAGCPGNVVTAMA